MVVTLSAGLASAQSLGDLARRERERRAALGKRARVFTNEDLARTRILEPAPVASSKQNQKAQPSAVFAPSGAAALEPGAGVPLWKMAEQPGFSLGEYARRLREQRALQQGSPTAPQVAGAPASPALIPAPEPATGFSLAEYARRLEAERRRQRLFLQSEPSESIPTAPDHSEIGSAPDPIRVRRGDSMWKLSFVYLGDGKLWTSLWKANHEIRNPNLIHPGQLLRWPEAQLLARNAGRSGAAAGNKQQAAVRSISQFSGENGMDGSAVAVRTAPDALQLREKKPRPLSPSSPSSPSTIGSKASRSSTAERNSSYQGAVRS